MIVVGVVGGVASGKTLVTDHLKSLGAVVLDADRVGHDVLKLPHVIRQIREHWGNAVIGEDGLVDRSQLAQIVFDPSNVQQLERLEQITHPLIKERLQEQIQQIRAAGRAPMIVLDAAIMVKTGWYRLCDEIVFVDAITETRLARAAARGWSAEMLARREAAQAPIERKKELSTIQIDNNGTRQATYRQVQLLWDRLVNHS